MAKWNPDGTLDSIAIFQEFANGDMKMQKLLKVGVVAVLLTLFGTANVYAADKGSTVSFAPPMARINPGSFDMGAHDDDEVVSKMQQPVHHVTIGYAFEIGKTEITQDQWKAIMGDNPSTFSNCGGDCPVESVSFDDMKRYLKRLNIKTHKEYRLPTEAEWEYACRAGGKDEYCGGNIADKLGWYESNSGKETSPVASKTPNAWGLYDMSGNVYEMTQDCWHDSYQGAPVDGSAWEDNSCRTHVSRGGSFETAPERLRAARRAYHSDEEDADGKTKKSRINGFRIARTLP